MTVSRVPPSTFTVSLPAAGAETSRHASRQSRAVSSILRNNANQVGTPIPRPTQATNGAPAPAPAPASSPAPAPAAETEQARGLLASLSSSQNRMVEYRDTLPAASDVVKETVADWFQKEHPQLAATLGEQWPSRLTVLSKPGGPGTPVTEAPLAELPWEPQWGEGRMPLQGLIVVHTDLDGRSRIVRDLNSSAALRSMTDQLRAPRLAEAYRTRQASYWSQPGIVPGKTRAESLAFEFGAQLRSEAALRQDDGTLSADGLQTVEDVLASPDMSTRQRGEGPGIHRLMVQGRPQPGAFVLTQRDNEKDPGAVLLWQPGRPLQEFSNVQEMRAWAAADRKIPEASVQTLDLLTGNRFESRLRIPLTANLFASRVNDLRDESDRQFERALRQKPPAGQTWASQMDAATDAGAYLDLSPAIQARRELKDAEAYRQWLTSGPDTALKQEWHEKFGAYAKLAADYQNKAKGAPADYVFHPERYGGEARVRQYASEKLREELAATAKDVDPDTTYLQFEEKEQVDYMLTPALDESDFGSSSSALQPISKTVTKKISLTDWALRNADYTQKVGFFRNFTYNNATLVDAQGKQINGLTVDDTVAAINKVDVGATYPAHLKTTLLDAEAGKASAHHYATLQQARLRAELPATLLNEEDTVHGSVAPYRSWIKTVVDAPNAANRALVSDTPIEVRPLRLEHGSVPAPNFPSPVQGVSSVGHTLLSAPEGTSAPIRGVWVVQPQGLGADRPLILMTPGAPDGRTFRRFQSTTHMQDSLKADPAMRQYLAARVGPTVGPGLSLTGYKTYATSAENAKTILGGKGDWMTQAPAEEGNFLTQEYEDGVNVSIERARHAATSKADADANVTGALFRWAGDAVLSNAPPIISVPYTLIRMGISVIDGAKSVRDGNGPQAEQHFLEAFERLADLVPGPSAKAGSAASRLTPLRRLPEARPESRVTTKTIDPLDAIRPAPELSGQPPAGRATLPGSGENALRGWEAKGRTSSQGLEAMPQRGLWKVPNRQEYYQQIGNSFYPAQQRGHGWEIYNANEPGGSVRGRPVRYGADGNVEVAPEGNRGLGGGGDRQTPGGTTPEPGHSTERVGLDGRPVASEQRRPAAGSGDVPLTGGPASRAPQRPSAAWDANLPSYKKYLYTAGMTDELKRAKIEVFRRDQSDFYIDYHLAERMNSVKSRQPLTLRQDETLPGAIDEFYRHGDGVVFGERHNSRADELLARNIPTLKHAGVTVLFLEAFCEESVRWATIKQHLAQKDMNALNAIFRSVGRPGFGRLLMEAQDAGIRIEPLESVMVNHDLGKSVGTSSQGTGSLSVAVEDRMSDMNYYAALKIKQTVKPGEKWAALVGRGHAMNFRGTPGVNHLTGAYSIQVAVPGVREFPRTDFDYTTSLPADLV